jgi:hypothetical protein
MQRTNNEARGSECVHACLCFLGNRKVEGSSLLHNKNNAWLGGAIAVQNTGERMVVSVKFERPCRKSDVTTVQFGLEGGLVTACRADRNRARRMPRCHIFRLNVISRPEKQSSKDATLPHLTPELYLAPTETELQGSDAARSSAYLAPRGTELQGCDVARPYS